MHGWHLPKMANISIHMEGIAQNSPKNRQKQPKIAKIGKKNWLLHGGHRGHGGHPKPSLFQIIIIRREDEFDQTISPG